jgi:hypothetical protein
VIYTILLANCVNQCHAARSNVSNSAGVDQCQSRCIKPSRPDGGLVCMALKSPADGPDRSIATETRFPRDVRPSLNFRHNVAGARTTLRAMCGRLQVGGASGQIERGWAEQKHSLAFLRVQAAPSPTVRPVQVIHHLPVSMTKLLAADWTAPNRLRLWTRADG